MSDFYQFNGVAASPGLAAATSLRHHSINTSFPRHSGCDYQKEVSRIKEAKEDVIDELNNLSNKISKELSEDEGKLFQAHALIAEDSELEKKYNDSLLEGLNAEAAWMDAIEHFAGQLERLPDPTLSARAIDIRDVGRHVLRHMMNYESDNRQRLSGTYVLIAEELTPSETVDLDKSKVFAFCTARGGPSSHTVILAKAIGIPAVVGLGDSILKVKDGTEILVNGNTGIVIINPDKKTTEMFLKDMEIENQRIRHESSSSHEPATTTDMHRIEIVANIGIVSDALKALENGAEGVGVFRTEFLFLKRNTPPDEETQYKAYRQVFEVMGDLPVTVRTLDAGGDKDIPYLDTGEESNPFLGRRAIRVCLDYPEVFRTQLRALLRAGAGHDLRIMFPMISTIEELRSAKAHLEAVKQELYSGNITFMEYPKTGIMVETPAAVVMIDQLAKEVDFFSIGTNDLTQYSMAADRTNENVAYLNDACHPAILRQIKQVTDAGHKSGIRTDICGELASDPDAIPILLGLEVDELSLSPNSIPGVKSIIRSWSWEKSKSLAQEALEKETSSEVRALVRARV